MNSADRIVLLNINWIKAQLFMNLTGYTVRGVKKLQNDPNNLILCTAPDGSLMVNFPLFQMWALHQRVSKKVIANNGINLVQTNVYAELSGYSCREIKRKKESGDWNEQIIFIAPDGNELINIKEVEKWVTKTKK